MLNKDDTKDEVIVDAKELNSLEKPATVGVKRVSKAGAKDRVEKRQKVGEHGSGVA